MRSDLSASGDVAQAALIPGDLKGKLDWLNGKVSWHKGASVNTTFTNAGPDAMVVGSTGNGVLLGWVAHPDNSMAQASETLPISRACASRPARPARRSSSTRAGNWPMVSWTRGRPRDPLMAFMTRPFGTNLILSEQRNDIKAWSRMPSGKGRVWTAEEQLVEGELKPYVTT